MKVSVAALLGVRTQLGWSQAQLDFSGTTLSDLLKKIKVQNTRRNLYQVLVQKDGTVNK